MDFICGFLALVNHSFHEEVPQHYRTDVVVQMVTAQTPDAVVTEKEVTPLKQGVTHLVTMVYRNSHFAVLLFDINDHHVTVYDGLNASIKRWTKHVTFVFAKYGLEKCDADPQEEYTQNGVEEFIEIDYDDGENSPWTMAKDPVLKQHDGFNCGPIACLKVMEIYGMVPLNSIEEIRHSSLGYRGVVMEFYVAMINKYNRDIHFTISNKANVQKYINYIKSLKKNEGVDDDKSAATNEAAKNREEATAMKKKRQEMQAKKMMKQCGDAAIKSGIGPGAVVTLQVDYRTHYNPEGLIAIVYDFRKDTGSIKVCCKDGVITHDGAKGDYWVPADKYVLKAAPDVVLPLPDDLARIRKLVIHGRYDDMDAPRISYSKLHQKQTGATSPTKRSKGCNCKKGECGNKCGCKIKKMECHSGCSCNGNCGVVCGKK